MHFWVLFFVLNSCCVQPQTANIDIIADSSFQVTENRLEMTTQYAHRHYGINDYSLHEPKIIVIHYTVIPTLQQTLNYFRRDSIERQRGKLYKKSPLNVGVHFVVDKDGTIYSQLPDTIMGRHIIGYNHTSIGIENIAMNTSDLTPKQVESNARLVKYLSEKHPSIQYLMGHFEYDDKSLPHYKLLLVKDTRYAPYPKIDPGVDFMRDLRTVLKTKYDLEFKK